MATSKLVTGAGDGHLARVSDDLFEHRPIELDGFKLHATGVDVIGRPKFEAWGNALAFARAAGKSAPYWIGDLLAYAGTRGDYKALMEQVLELTGIALSTAQNYTTVCRRVEPSTRALSPGIAHTAIVAALEPADQVHWLKIATEEQLSSRDLTARIRSASRRKVIEGQAILEGEHRVIMADPPWLYDDRQPSGSSSQAHYPGLSIENICQLPIAAHAAQNAVLGLWVPSPLMFQSPGPREVGVAWGFTYKATIVWDKVDGAGGNYTRGNHELFTIWTRGRCIPDVQTDLPDSVQTIRKSPVHSEKPEEFRRLMEKHWTSGPYLELFGRQPVEGWTVFGNDARLWGQDAR